MALSRGGIRALAKLVEEGNTSFQDEVVDERVMEDEERKVVVDKVEELEKHENEDNEHGTTA
jgi:hypothetical protein